MSQAPPNEQLADVVYRNIKDISELQREIERERTRHERTADAVTRFAGTFHFLFLQIFGAFAWIFVNLGLVKGIAPFDPPPFGILTGLATLEAVLLSTFILISQNRMSKLNERRSNLDLQINLLSEHEITHLVRMVETLSLQMGVSEVQVRDDLKKEVSPRTVLSEIESVEKSGKT